MSSLIEIRNQLMNHFQNKDFFSLKDHSNMIKVDKEQSNIKNDLIRMSFKLIEEAKIVLYSKTDIDEIWALESPLQTHGQEIMISFKTAEDVANLLNQFKEVLGNGKNVQPTDKLNINEFDISQLCMLCQLLLEKEETKEK